MDYLKIRNWDTWQTYRKDRGQPPWIKVHRRVMRNPDWVSLTDAERGQLVAIWLLAADHDGAIPASPEVIQKLCFMSKQPDLNKFTDLGFIENGWRHNGVNVASSGSQRDQPKAEENRIEKNTSSKSVIFEETFTSFWKNYPRKVGKKDAQKAWNKVKDPKNAIEKMKKILPEQKASKRWNEDDGKYIPHPATYIRQERWEDETIE